jgi:hypothetical protein
LQEFHAEAGHVGTGLAVYNGNKLWHSIDGVTIEQPTQYARGASIAYYGWLLPLLDDPVLKLSVLPNRKVRGAMAEGVRVTGKGHLSASLYFDKCTHLLLMVETTRFSADDKPTKATVYLGEYKSVQGVQWPFWRLQVGPFREEIRVKTFKILKQIPPETFAKPS